MLEQDLTVKLQSIDFDEFFVTDSFWNTSRHAIKFRIATVLGIASPLVERGMRSTECPLVVLLFGHRTLIVAVIV